MTTAKVSARALLDLLDRDDAAAEEAHSRRSELALPDKVHHGYAIDGVELVGPGRRDGTWQLSCISNYSRIRPGDYVSLVGEPRMQFRVIDVGTNELILAGKSAPPIEGSGAFEQVRSLYSDSARDALKMLGDRTLGTAVNFLHAMNGQASKAEDAPTNPAELLATLEAESGRTLNKEQRNAWHAAIRAPNAWGVEGPPGTGKTLVASFVAEGFARARMKVLVTAHSHEAVNELLREVTACFPARTVRKVSVPERGPEDPGIEVIPFWRWIRGQGAWDDAIVGMTLTAAVSAFCAASDEKLDSFKLRRDVLIVEEAGQVPLPLGACAGHLAASVLMFGDQGQLGAIYSFDEADDPLAISLFARFHQVQPGAIAFLPQTERLNTQLANIVGTTWYASSTGASRLSPTETAAKGRLAYRATNDTWANGVLDPAHALTWVACGANDTRTHCAAEAAQAARLIVALRSGGVEQVMVVSPYRQQVREIQNALAETNAPDVVVDTIERAQGRTVDAVIVSFAASERDYLKDNCFFFSDQRWNVAFSRARHKVVVLGSPEVRRTAHNSPVARQAQMRLGRVLEQAHRVSPPDPAEGPAGTR